MEKEYEQEGKERTEKGANEDKKRRELKENHKGIKARSQAEEWRTRAGRVRRLTLKGQVVTINPPTAPYVYAQIPDIPRCGGWKLPGHGFGGCGEL